MASRVYILRDSGQYFPADALEKLATTIGVKVTWSLHRCQHGKTLMQGCRQCDNGYVDDLRPHFITRSTPVMAAITDDGEWIAYIPARYKHKVEEYFKKNNLDFDDYPTVVEG